MVVKFIKDDFSTNWWRACIETIGMIASVIVAIILALTTPHPPMLLCYTLWMVTSTTLCFASWHRGSTGLTFTYAAFLVIDGIGLFRTLAY